MKTLSDIKAQNEELHEMLEAIVETLDAQSVKPSPQP